MLRDLKFLNNGESINQRKRLPEMDNIVGGAQSTICKGTFYGMYMNHLDKNYDEWAEERKRDI